MKFKFSHLFKYYGKVIANNKCVMICFMISITLILSVGISQLDISDDPNSLWVDQQSEVQQQLLYYNDKFGEYYRINQLMLSPKNNTLESYIFSHEYLAMLWILQDAIESSTIQSSSSARNISVTDLCYKPIADKWCLIPSPLDYWKKNFTMMMNDNDIQQTTLCITSNYPGQIPCSDINGIPVQQNAALGGIHCNYTSTEPCSPCLLNSSALAATYLLNSNEFTQADAEAWELNVFIDKINAFNNGTLLNDPKYINITKQYISQQSLDSVWITYMAQRSIPDDLLEQTNQNIWVVVLSYVIMFLYVSIAIGRGIGCVSMKNRKLACTLPVQSGILLAIGGILIVMCSILSAIGLSAFMGNSLSLISAEVVPFLILAIGVDNMFIISNAFRRCKEEKVEDKIAQALYEVGPSITTAAICEFVAFMVGTFTGVPALYSFCIIAGFAVLFDYLFQITAFSAFICLDELRQQNKKLDLLFCIKAQDQFQEIANNDDQEENQQEPDKEFIKNIFDKYYIPVIFNKYAKITTYLICLFFFLIAFFGCARLELGLNQEISVISDSSIYDYFVVQNIYGDAGPEAFVVLENVNYTDNQTQLVIANISDSLSKLSKYIQPPIYNWFSTFQQFIKNETATGGLPAWSQICHTQDIGLLSFNEQITQFKQVRIDSDCCQQYGICGEQYQQDIIQNPDTGDIVATRLRFSHQPLITQADYINSYQQTQKIVKYFSNKFNNIGRSPDNQQKAFAFSLYYVYFNQYDIIRGVAISDVLLAIMCVYGATTIIKNAKAGFFVILGVFLTTFDMLGLTFLFNHLFQGYSIQINAVSVVNLITAVGLSNEFCVHIVLKFMNSRGSAEFRAKKSLSIMGSSVLVGIVCTKFLGVVVLGFASSTLFRLYYFRMYMMIIILGTFHGLVFLPVLLSDIGPYRISKIVKDQRPKGSLAQVTDKKQM